VKRPAAPPGFVTRFLERVLPEDHREPLLGDLEERFQTIARERGARAAQLWYLRQALQAPIVAPRRIAHTHNPGDGSMSNLWSDIRHGRASDLVLHHVVYVLRQVRKSPAFYSVVVATLAVGIGAVLTMYDAMSRVLLRPPPHVVEPVNVVKPYFRYEPGDGLPRTSAVRDYGFYAHVIASSPWTLAALSVYASRELPIGSGLHAEFVPACFVSGGYWSALGVAPRVGRFFAEEESVPGSGARVAVLSHTFWTNHFGGKDSAVGSTILVRGLSYTVIGVAPDGFRGVEFDRTSLWLPISAYADGEPNALTWHRTGTVQFVGRLSRESTDSQAAAELTSLYGAYQNPHRPVLPRPQGARTTVVLGSVAGLWNGALERPAEARLAVWLLAIATVLLVAACITAGTLLLLRATQRRGELAVRTALGLSSGRLVLERVIESAVLAVAGAAGGLLIFWWLGGLLNGLLVPRAEWQPLIRESLMVVTAVTCVVMLAGIGGIVPLVAGRSSLAARLREGAVQTTRRSQVGRAFLVAQATLTVVLLVGAGLFLKTLGRIGALDLGMDVERVYSATFASAGSGRPASEIGAAYEAALSIAATVPGIEAASVASTVPLRSARSGGVEFPSAVATSLAAGQGLPSVNYVTPGFFETMGMQVTEGRGFRDDDRGGAPVMVVNETIARLGWPGRTPIGNCLPYRRGGECATVVGVVRDARAFGLRESGWLYYYQPLPERSSAAGTLLFRLAASGSGGATTLLQALIRNGDRWPPVKIERVGEALDPQVRPYRLGALIFAVFAAVAVLLSAFGLYTTLAYSVSLRRRETGLRLALGATSGVIASAVLRDGSAIGVVAVALGSAIALLAGRRVGEFLFDVSPSDPWVFGAVAVTTIIVCIAASALPAWRASRVPPSEAMRAE